jgi:membrane-associated HD superfamily phosphohydrolase
MKYFLRSASYFFHPLLMPLFGALLYYHFTPRFFEPELIRAKSYALIIITILIPLITFYLLKNLGLVTSIQLKEVRERKFPLMVQTLLLLIVIKMVFSSYQTPEMYYFFVGVLFSTIAALLLVILNFKISLHQMGIAGVTMFIIALSAHFSINYLFEIACIFFINGWVASSRLQANSHTISELLVGFLIGFFPQLIMLNYWQ